MAEAEILSGLLGICGVDTSGSGLPSVPAMRSAIILWVIRVRMNCWLPS